MKNLRLLWLAALLWSGFAQAASQLPVVAVWDFEDQTVPAATSLTGLDFLKRSLSEAVLSALIEVPGLKVVERLQLKDILAEQKLGTSDLADADTRQRLGRILGAQRMVFGSFMAVGDQIRVNLRVVDSATSQVVVADEGTAGFDRVLAEAQKMAQRLAKVLGGREVRPAKVQATALWAEYDQALALADAGQYAAAIEALKSVLSKDRDFAVAERQLIVLLEKLSRQ